MKLLIVEFSYIKFVIPWIINWLLNDLILNSSTQSIQKKHEQNTFLELENE